MILPVELIMKIQQHPRNAHIFVDNARRPKYSHSENAVKGVLESLHNKANTEAFYPHVALDDKQGQTTHPSITESPTSQLISIACYALPSVPPHDRSPTRPMSHSQNKTTTTTRPYSRISSCANVARDSFPLSSRMSCDQLRDSKKGFDRWSEDFYHSIYLTQPRSTKDMEDFSAFLIAEKLGRKLPPRMPTRMYSLSQSPI